MLDALAFAALKLIGQEAPATRDEPRNPRPTDQTV
jgi:hypothetical protein